MKSCRGKKCGGGGGGGAAGGGRNGLAHFFSRGKKLTGGRTGLLQWGHRIADVTKCVLPCPRTSIVRGNYVRATSMKRRNKIVQEITLIVANVFSFYAIIAIEHGFSMH